MRIFALLVCAGMVINARPVVADEPAQVQAVKTSAPLIVIRFSERLFDPLITKEIRASRAVNDVIVGTHVRGRSETRGKVNVDISRNPHDASLIFTFSGQTAAQTVGRNGPVMIHSRALTHFQCSCPVTFDLENGFRAGKTTIRSHTEVTPVRVDPVKRGLRGRLIRRVAWRRVMESRAQAQAESAALAKRDIVAGFERKLSEQLAQLNQRAATTELVTALLGGITDTKYSVSSTDRHIELCIRRRGTPEEPAKVPEYHVADAPIQVWVNSSLMETELFNAVRSLAVIRDSIQPIARAALAGWRNSDRSLQVIRRIGGWQLWDRPFFDRRFIARLATRSWATRQNRQLIGLDTAENWLVFGINDVAVRERRAIDVRNTAPVSSRR